VRVDGFEGRITNINARYTLIRSVTGRESIVPNEMLITQRVENLSLADTSVWQSVQVSVGYGSDVDQVMALLLQACTEQDRVLSDPRRQWPCRPLAPMAWSSLWVIGFTKKRAVY
jgi:small-conductance mechanosensitive channel